MQGSAWHRIATCRRFPLADDWQRIKMKPLIRPIRAADTRPLRQAVLRPGQPAERNVYPYDDSGLDFHAGAFENDLLVGVASIFHESPPGEENAGAWRLRGMAVLPEKQRHGYGRALLKTCLDHIAAGGGTKLWCNAFIDAVPFYEANGLQIEGEPFELPDGRLYCRMWAAINPACEKEST